MDMRPQSPDQAKGISDLVSKLQTPIRVAKLAAMSALYRDIHLTARSIHRRMAHGSSNPVVSEASSTTSKQTSSGSSAFPILDVSKLPDSDAPAGRRLEQR